MAANLIQSGETFHLMLDDGSHSIITLPAGVVVTDTRKPRFEVSGVHAIVVNSVDPPIIVDEFGIALPLSPISPANPPTVIAGTAGSLSGVYGVKYTFAIRDLDGKVVAESGYSAPASVTVSSEQISVSNIDTLSGLNPAIYGSYYEVVRNIYRTTSGGATYFLWHTLTDNTTTSFEDGASDASLGALASDILGSAPYLSNIASFKERLFGVDDSTNREVLLYSETGLRWAWPPENIFTMPQMKGDSQSGITALMPFRNSLGITKSNMLFSLTGTDDSTFTLTTLSTSIGCVSQETCAQYRDAWYFLGQDGVYRWSENGIESISDGKVRSWFTTDEYFNRQELHNAFGIVDILNKTYKLCLPRANQTAVNTWVEFDIESGTWWGPHTTAAYTITATLMLGGRLPSSAFGSSLGYVAIDQEPRHDNGYPIELNAITTPIRAADPPVTTYFGTLTPEIAPQPDGDLTIYPIVGELAEPEDPPFTHPLSDPSVALGRLGYGRYLVLRFFHNTFDQIVQILGFEVDPVNTVGRRE